MSGKESLLRFWWNCIIVTGNGLVRLPWCPSRALNHSCPRTRCFTWWQIHVKLGPTGLRSQLPVPSRGWTHPENIWGDGMVHKRLRKHSVWPFLQETHWHQASPQTLSDKQWTSSPAALCWWPGAAGICMCLDYFLQQLFTWAVNIHSIFIQDLISIFWNKH